jgi:hypothetical protein
VNQLGAYSLMWDSRLCKLLRRRSGLPFAAILPHN